MNLIQRFSAVAVFVLVCAISLEAAHKLSLSKHTEVDLALYGYEAANFEPEVGIHFRSNGVVFQDTSHLVVHFISRVHPTERPKLVQRNSPSSYQLNVLLVDIRSNAVVKKMTLPTKTYASRIFAGARGNLVIRTGTLLTFYSPQWDELQQRQLAATDTNACNCIHISPSGRTLWLTAGRASSKTFEAIDLDTFSTTLTFTERNLGDWWSASDHALVTRTDNGTTSIFLKELNGSWKEIFDREGCYAGAPVLLSEDRIALPGCKSIEILSDKGRLVGVEKLMKSERVESHIAIARDAGYAAFALKTTAHKNNFEPPRLATRILLYDFRNHQSLGYLSLDPLPRNHFDYSLSPDGSYLAALVDGRLMVYKLAPE